MRNIAVNAAFVTPRSKLNLEVSKMRLVLEMRCSKPRYLSDFELVNLSDNEVIEQV